MTTENELMTKSYYQSIIGEKTGAHPIKVLGEMYMEEMKKDQPDLAAIRFAQGEVYFLNHDYEAAIHKWQQAFDHGLIPWGEKNIADAYLEMGLLDEAEALYRDVEAESDVLTMEVLLQLFSLYIEQEKRGEAVRVIKEAVELDPDYSNVTEIAKRYFEQIENWDDAIELAIDESVRTGDVDWFLVVESYLDRQLLTNKDPSAFHALFVSLYNHDQARFEHLIERFWHSYDNGERYVDWLKAINAVLSAVKLDKSLEWHRLSDLFEEGYFYLMSGRFLIDDMSELMVEHLTNWLYLSLTTDALVASSAIIAWDEAFSGVFPVSLINEARFAFDEASPHKNGKKDGLQLFESIGAWAKEERMSSGLQAFTEEKLGELSLADISAVELRDLIKESLAYIVTEKKQVEEAIEARIEKSQAIRTELTQFKGEVEKDEVEKVKLFAESFRDVKNKLKETIKVELTQSFKNCSDLISADDDFSTLDASLNKAMNERAFEYIEGEFLPDYQSAFSEWIKSCEVWLEESRVVSVEFEEKINEAFGEERLHLAGDAELLKDWRRDIDRASRALLQKREVNILLRKNPSQLFFKGAGKLVGSLTGSKEPLLNKYKDYLKNGHYRDAVIDFTKTFFQQLDALEESIVWDIEAYFQAPKDALSELAEEVAEGIEKDAFELREMRENPKLREDPLKLFSVKLRHYELIYQLDQKKESTLSRLVNMIK